MVKVIERNIKSIATLSDDENYRYRLTRIWDEKSKRACVIMLNPSKANELKTDKTVMNVTNFLIDHEFGSVDIVNLFSFMATKPKDLRNRVEQFEKINDSIIKAAISESDIIIIAWVRDNTKFIKNRKIEIEKLLIPYYKKVKCFQNPEGIKPHHPRDLGPKWSLVKYDFMYVNIE